MKGILLLLVFGVVFFSKAQDLTFKKGGITDHIKVNDSIDETFAVYLPGNFDMSKKWPVLFVYDMQGRGEKVLRLFSAAAEHEGYVLAASNNIHDSLSISKNVLISHRMFNSVFSLFPIKKERTYAGGVSGGARFASLLPTFIKDVKGVISAGSSLPNSDILSIHKPYHFIGIVGNEDYNYSKMLANNKTLNKLKFPNQVLIFDGGEQWPNKEYVIKALQIFTFSAMASGNMAKNDSLIRRAYQKNLIAVNTLVNANKSLRAEHLLVEMISVYASHQNIDSLKLIRKKLRKTKLFRSQYRNHNAVFLKETLIKEDYGYYLEEDILTYNFNNLGWWTYQMEVLGKYEKSSNPYEQQMAKRLCGYVNALIEDNIDGLKAEKGIDLEALNLLYMLKTITAPKDYTSYLRVISNSAKMEDFGTALFYLEELLKNGFTNKKELYSLKDTGLLRITPEYKEIIVKYLDTSSK